MEVSSIAAISRAYLSSPSSDTSTHGRIKFAKWQQALFISTSGRSAKTLDGRDSSSIRKYCCIKVFCSQKKEIPIVSARCMDDVYNALAERLVPTASVASNPNSKAARMLDDIPINNDNMTFVLEFNGLRLFKGCLFPHATNLSFSRLNHFVAEHWLPGKSMFLLELLSGLELHHAWNLFSLSLKHFVAEHCLQGKSMSLYILGLAGPPGAGKSTLASEVVQRVNNLWPQKASSFDSQVEPMDVAIVLPMDGFHLYRSQLDAMEDPEEAHARRGAPSTFNPERLLVCLKNLRDQGSVYVPSFDHSVGDPVEDDIFVSLRHRVVIVEGNYLLLEEGVWEDVSSIFDEKWFIDVDIDKAMQRVLKRHVSTGKAPDVARWRIEYNDQPNAELIMKSKKNADLIIKSIDFQT